MRTMLRWTVPVAKGNKAIKKGTIMEVIEHLMERLEPEAAYFQAHDGKRSGMLVFDMKDPAEIPQIAEPLFLSLNAAVEFTPVMNMDDLRRALANVES